MSKKKNKYVILVVVTILVSIIALIGATYALLTMTIQGDKTVSLTAGILKVDFTDGNYINLDNAAPVSDSSGQKTTPYTFTITNTGNINAYYHVSLEEESNNTLANSYLKMRLTNDQGYDSGVVKVNSYGTREFDITNEYTLESKDKVTYKLWMWLDENADNSAQGKIYKSKIVVTSYDREQGSNAIQLLKSKASTGISSYSIDSQPKELQAFSHDATEQTESLTDYRYIGSDPNNYIIYNNETWRIIGIFTVDDGSGKKEERLKIIRNESIGNIAWDTNNTNNWATATLNSYLNLGDYWTNLLGENAKDMIDNAVWYLGGTVDFTTNGLVSNFYSYERSTAVYNGRTANYIGKVGLMYPSDFGYATNGGSTTDRDTCLNQALSNWSNISDCYNNDWLFNTGGEWMLTPSTYDSTTVFGFSSSSSLSLASINTSSVLGVRPVVFLKSNVKIIDGDGSSSNPYIL